jgi:HPt (histidine-containing phosphotransfer) domain-containing protein
MSDRPIIDQAALIRLQGLGGDKLVVQMARLYLENARERLAQIESAFTGGAPISEAESGAHSLKSSAANIGAVRVNELASTMEATAARGDVEAVDELRGPLKQAVDDSETRLKELLGGLSE